MRHLFIVLITILAFTSCNEEKQDIEFKKLVNLDLGNLSKENGKLRATAVFMNLSDQEYDFKDLVLDFTIDGKDVGTVVTKISKKIKPNSEFSIPVLYSFETASFIAEGEDPSNTYAVQLLGDLTLKNAKGEEITTAVKHATTYTYMTKKDERLNKREERKKRREEKKAAKND